MVKKYITARALRLWFGYVDIFYSNRELCIDSFLRGFVVRYHTYTIILVEFSQTCGTGPYFPHFALAKRPLDKNCFMHIVLTRIKK